MTLRQKIEEIIKDNFSITPTASFLMSDMMDEIMNEISKEVYGKPMLKE